MAEEKLIPQSLVLQVLCAIQGALDDENQRVFAKAGRILGAEWAKMNPRAENVDGLMEKLAAHLRTDLQLAENVTLEKEGADYVIKVRGCRICHGELVKEKHGISPACAISMLPVGAVTKNLGVKNARLKEIRKPGPIGDCDMVFEIKA